MSAHDAMVRVQDAACVFLLPGSSFLVRIRILYSAAHVLVLVDSPVLPHRGCAFADTSVCLITPHGTVQRIMIITPCTKGQLISSRLFACGDENNPPRYLVALTDRKRSSLKLHRFKPRTFRSPLPVSACYGAVSPCRLRWAGVDHPPSKGSPKVLCRASPRPHTALSCMTSN